jgi:hypothetical protein
LGSLKLLIGKWVIRSSGLSRGIGAAEDSQAKKSPWFQAQTRRDRRKSGFLSYAVCLSWHQGHGELTGARQDSVQRVFKQAVGYVILVTAATLELGLNPTGLDQAAVYRSDGGVARWLQRERMTQYTFWRRQRDGPRLVVGRVDFRVCLRFLLRDVSDLVDHESVLSVFLLLREVFHIPVFAELL